MLCANVWVCGIWVFCVGVCGCCFWVCGYVLCGCVCCVCVCVGVLCGLCVGELNVGCGCARVLNVRVCLCM